LIDWRIGEQWFMQHLIDGDLPQIMAVGNGVPQQEQMLYLFSDFQPNCSIKKFDPEGNIFANERIGSFGQ
jgi:deoxyribodipyrimidine photolyase